MAGFTGPFKTFLSLQLLDNQFEVFQKNVAPHRDTKHRLDWDLSKNIPFHEQLTNDNLLILAKKRSLQNQTLKNQYLVVVGITPKKKFHWIIFGGSFFANHRIRLPDLPPPESRIHGGIAGVVAHERYTLMMID